MPNMQLIQDTIEQARTMPTIEAPVAFAGSLVATAIGSLALWREHGRSEEAFKVHTPNPSLEEETIRQVFGDKAEASKYSRRARMSAPLIGLTGLGMTAAAVLGGLTYETTSQSTDSAHTIVLDRSYSMLTQDVGADSTRLSVALEGLDDAKYVGELGVVEFGANNYTRVPLSVDWESQTSLLKDPAVNETGEPIVDPNGGNLSAALQAATEMLPLEIADDGKTILRDGTITIISDGTVESSADELAEIAKASGAEINVIVPGTAEGSYVLAGTEVESGIQTDVFKPFDQVTVVANASDITEAVNQSVETSGKTTRREDWRLLTGLGMAMMATGIFNTSVQIASKKV